jgi:hypothetical protein
MGLEVLGDHWIITRRPDHTFTEYRTNDYPKPSTQIVSTGTWSMRGDAYCLHYLSVSQPFYAKHLIGHDVCDHIDMLTPTRLELSREDAERIVEHKVAE